MDTNFSAATGDLLAGNVSARRHIRRDILISALPTAHWLCARPKVRWHHRGHKLEGLRGRVAPDASFKDGLFHETAIVQHARFGTEWEGAYTFGVVRNPYSWAVSRFFFDLGRCNSTPMPATYAGPFTHFYSRTCKYKATIAESLNKSLSRRIFVQAHAFTSWLAEGDNTTTRTSNHSLGRPLTLTQLEWLSSGGGAELLVRNVVKLEDANEFAAHATCDGLKAIMSNCGERNGTGATAVAAQMRPSTHEAWSLYYTPYACEIVRSRFARDFAAFDTTCRVRCAFEVLRRRTAVYASGLRHGVVAYASTVHLSERLFF